MGEVNKQTFADFLRKYFKMGLFKIIPNQELSGSRERKAPARPADQDLVSAAIGDYGRWQLLITFLISLFSFPCTFHMYMSNFTVAKSDYWCARPNNLSSVPVSIWKQYSQPNGPCTIRQLPDGITAEAIFNNTAPVLDTFMKCTNWEFDKSEISSTIISEWLLVCERQGLTNLAEAMFLLGVGLGGVIGGWVSDKFGRKRILMFMVLAQTTLALLSLMVRSYFQYVVLRLFVGFVSVSVVYAAFVLAVEIVGGKWVTIAGVCNFFPLPLAYIIVSLVSLLLPDWRNLTLALSIPGCSLLILWFVIPESPRWLLSMGRIKETKVILQRAANFNGRALPSDIDKQLELKKAEILGQNENPGIVMLFKPPLRKRTFCLAVAWFAMTIGYYGLVLNIGNFDIWNVHSTSIILAVVEVPAIALSIPVLLKAGRRIPIFITMVVCGLACLATEVFAIAYKEKWVMIGCLMVGKFAIAMTNMMLPIFTAELYPTVVRNLGVGGSQVSAGMALIIIPYLWNLTAFSAHLPMVTMAVLIALGGGVVLLLPDTVDHTAGGDVIADKTTTDNTVVPNGTFVIADSRSP
ncbi:organic cation transporter protein isoform X2 [Plutella xylostella]|uniref:organic cation transporter protein isoform X2 n=1 Tax=Plutella xylostella TaxID=51655 RepID=UPI0020327BC6|nr:organic cation transporter protein isoform X2 [Plutella xylostella]